MSRIAIITGSSRGIGAAAAILAARDGWDVCINYAADKTAADCVVAECGAIGVRAVAVKANIADREEVADLFTTCDAQLGNVSLLINNAGVIGKATRVAELSGEVLQETFAVNVFGAIYCAQQAVRRMALSNGGEGGVIVNVSSGAAVLGSPGEYVHYAASKGAIDSFTVGLAREVGRDGVRVCAVRAGTTNTDIHVTSGDPDHPVRAAERSPTGRIAEPCDIAEAIMWLASDKARHTAGAILSVTGGMVA